MGTCQSRPGFWSSCFSFSGFWLWLSLYPAGQEVSQGRGSRVAVEAGTLQRNIRVQNNQIQFIKDSKTNKESMAETLREKAAKYERKQNEQTRKTKKKQDKIKTKLSEFYQSIWILRTKDLWGNGGLRLNH